MIIGKKNFLNVIKYLFELFFNSTPPLLSFQKEAVEKDSASLTLPILILLHLEDIITLQLNVEEQNISVAYLIS